MAISLTTEAFCAAVPAFANCTAALIAGAPAAMAASAAAAAKKNERRKRVGGVTRREKKKIGSDSCSFVVPLIFFSTFDLDLASLHSLLLFTFSPTTRSTKNEIEKSKGSFIVTHRRRGGKGDVVCYVSHSLAVSLLLSLFSTSLSFLLSPSRFSSQDESGWKNKNETEGKKTLRVY